MSAALDQFAVQEAPASPVTYPKAPRGARFFAFVLDSIFSSLLNGVGLALITKGLKVDNEGVKILWTFAFLFMYQALPLYASGQTLGKRLMKVRIVSVEGVELSMGQVLMREFFLKGVSAMVFLLGFVRILTHPDGRAWHDKFAGTRAISIVEE